MPSTVFERNGRHVARITRKGRELHLGTFDTPEQAAKAVRKAARRHPPRQRTRERPPPPSHTKAGRARIRKPPTYEEVLRIAEEASTIGYRRWHGDLWADRRKAFILGAAFSGLRLFEMAQLTATDVRGGGHVDRGRLHVRNGKGGFEGYSLLFEPGWSAVMKVCPPTGYIFYDSIHDAWLWDRRRIREWFSVAAARAEVDCTFHTLRHFHACWLLDKGVAQLDVAAQLRHRDRGYLVGKTYGRFHDMNKSLDRIEALV